MLNVFELIACGLWMVVWSSASLSWVEESKSTPRTIIYIFLPDHTAAMPR